MKKFFLKKDPSDLSPREWCFLAALVAFFATMICCADSWFDHFGACLAISLLVAGVATVIVALFWALSPKRTKKFLGDLMKD